MTEITIVTKKKYSLLPPEIGMELRTSSSKCIIGVHPNVDETVDQGMESAEST